jgi:hypothetical protein
MTSDASLRARIAALSLHAQRDSRELTAPARAAALKRFELEVDPNQTLPPEERRRRAEAAQKVFMLKIARKSAQARRKR